MPSTYFGWSMLFFISFLLSRFRLCFFCLCCVLNREHLKCVWVSGSFTCTLRVRTNNASRCENLTVREHEITSVLYVLCTRVSVYVLLASFSWFACVTETRHCVWLLFVALETYVYGRASYTTYYSHFDSYIPYTLSITCAIVCAWAWAWAAHDVFFNCQPMVSIQISAPRTLT